MRKFFVSLFAFACFVGIGGEVLADICPVSADKFTLRAWQNNTDDEFLFDGNNVYECDNEFCEDGKVLTLDAGHVWQGEVIKERRKYICRHGLEDRWEVQGKDGNYEEYTNKDIEYVKDPKCEGVLLGQTKYAGTWSRIIYSQNTQDNEFIYADNKVYECDDDFCSKDTVKCFEAGHYWKGSQINSAMTYKCIGRRKWQQIEIKPNGCSSGDERKQNACDGLSGLLKSECEKCSRDGTGARWNDADKKCQCLDNTKTWNAEQGRCVAKGGGDNFIIREKTVLSKEKLVTAAEKLDTMFAGFKVSKWKNEEGKFNTARLASDSIAGVVLGTTGGLITSSVMKKKQVEQGFEDLQCVVGGQPVAGWGDEFMVGIQ